MHLRALRGQPTQGNLLGGARKRSGRCFHQFSRTLCARAFPNLVVRFAGLGKYKETSGCKQRPTRQRSRGKGVLEPNQVRRTKPSKGKNGSNIHTGGLLSWWFTALAKFNHFFLKKSKHFSGNPIIFSKLQACFIKSKYFFTKIQVLFCQDSKSPR